MGHNIPHRLLAVVFCLVVFASVTISATDYSKSELIEESSLCLECHDGMGETLQNSVHRLISDEHSRTSLAVGCISCHPGWEEHLDDPSAENISAGSDLSAIDLAKVCSTCHLTPHQAAMVSTDPHIRQGFSCSSCHTVHNNEARFLVKDDRDNYCTACHDGVALEFKRNSSHPLESGNIRCSDCHYPGDIQDPQMAAGTNWVCQDCHNEQAGPYIYEHPVVYTHLVEGSGCTECHQPHGSANDRLLRQPEESTCRQCHMTPVGHRSAHSGLAARHNCVECHSQVHGSDDNRLLLDPDLGMKMVVDCYECHDIN